jgi:thioredoxin 1
MNQTWKILIVVVLIVAIIGVISAKRSQFDKEGAGIPSSVPVSQVGDYQVSDEYKLENLTGKGMPLLVDIGAESCIPCKLMAPILDELKNELKGKIVVQFLNLDAYPGLAKEYKIKVKPTQIFYDVSGKELFRHEGFISKEDILLKWKELGEEL